MIQINNNKTALIFGLNKEVPIDINTNALLIKYFKDNNKLMVYANKPLDYDKEFKLKFIGKLSCDSPIYYYTVLDHRDVRIGKISICEECLFYLKKGRLKTINIFIKKLS